MSLEIGILLLGLCALLLDLAASSLFMPRIQLFGQRSTPYKGEDANPDTDSGSKRVNPKVAVYQCIVQNSDASEKEFSPPGLTATISIRGAGEFVAPYVSVCGPDEPCCEWVHRPRSVKFSIPLLRPHKSWFFRCFVTAETEEMELAVRVPTRWPVRRFLMSLSQNLFSYNPPIDEKRIVFRGEEDRTLSRGFRYEWPLQLLRYAMLAAAGTGVYNWACYPPERGLDGIRRAGPARELVFVGLALLVTALVLHALCRPRMYPLTQGYHCPRLVEPQDRSRSD